ncbi:HBL311Cp [Eremothecium sinecaudum]|uniref:HBL311Cp n=1 Tax=Eremothecium sinecaudum TaxID=45286 RepID=A0A125RDU1_9SACH|nr:HBL311Cp [Eremothecium sinecaudum]AMD18591.1 HBL311Cp [Eremothecium sinecaudum]
MPIRITGEKIEYGKDFQRPASMAVTEEDLLNLPDSFEFSERLVSIGESDTDDATTTNETSVKASAVNSRYTLQQDQLSSSDDRSLSDASLTTVEREVERLFTPEVQRRFQQRLAEMPPVRKSLRPLEEYSKRSQSMYIQVGQQQAPASWSSTGNPGSTSKNDYGGTNNYGLHPASDSTICGLSHRSPSFNMLSGISGQNAIRPLSLDLNSVSLAELGTSEFRDAPILSATHLDSEHLKCNSLPLSTSPRWGEHHSIDPLLAESDLSGRDFTVLDVPYRYSVNAAYNDPRKISKFNPAFEDGNNFSLLPTTNEIGHCSTLYQNKNGNFSLSSLEKILQRFFPSSSESQSN